MINVPSSGTFVNNFRMKTSDLAICQARRVFTVLCSFYQNFLIVPCCHCTCRVIPYSPASAPRATQLPVLCCLLFCVWMVLFAGPSMLQHGSVPLTAATHTPLWSILAGLAQTRAGRRLAPSPGYTALSHDESLHSLLWEHKTVSPLFT